MKPSVIFSAALLLPGLLAAQAQSATLIKFQDPKLPFSVGLPKGWVALNLKDGLSGLTVASQAKPPAALVRLLLFPKHGKAVNLNSEFAGFEKAVRESGASVKLQSQQAASYGGVSGILRQYTITNKAENLMMRVWFGNGSKNFYSFQMTVPGAQYAKFNPVFNQILASVKF